MIINPTVKEVALRSGVSTATVSRVVNRDPRISPETTARVLQAVADLGYAPNPFARGLKTSKSRTIGFIVPEFTNDFFMGIAKGVESRLQEDHYSLVICNANETVEDEQARLALLLERGVDGVIVVPSGSAGHHFQAAQSQGVPVVLVDRLVEGFDGDAVLADNVDGTVRALSAFLEQGRNHIGFIGGNQTLTSARERYEGYLQALAAHGVVPRPDWVRFGDFHTDSGSRLMAELIEQPSPPPVIFISNYFMHVGATRYLMEHRDPRRPAPELVSFDDMEFSFTLGFCRTIIRQPVQELGRQAATMLLARMAGGPPAGVIRLKTEVVGR